MRRRRTTIPAALIRPVPIRAKVPGSGAELWMLPATRTGPEAIPPVPDALRVPDPIWLEFALVRTIRVFEFGLALVKLAKLKNMPLPSLERNTLLEFVKPVAVKAPPESMSDTVCATAVVNPVNSETDNWASDTLLTVLENGVVNWT